MKEFKKVTVAKGHPDGDPLQVSMMLGSLLDQQEMDDFMAEADVVINRMLTVSCTTYCYH